MAAIRKRLTTVFTLLTAVIIVLVSLLVYHFTRRYLEQDFVHRLSVRTGVAAQARFEENDVGISIYNKIREKHLQRLPEEKEYFYDSIPNQNELPYTQLPDDFGQQLAEGKSVRFRSGHTYYVAVPYRHDQVLYTVLLSARNEVGEKILANLGKNLLLGVILSVVTVLVTSLLFSKQILQPITHMINNVKKISASNLRLRLNPKARRGELFALAQTFNDMLDRLETSFETQSNFVNRASHELRTPLTAIMGEAELALVKERSVADYQASLRIISHEAAQLEQLINILLELARAGNEEHQPFMKEIRLDELVLAVKASLDASTPNNRVQLSFELLPEDSSRITVVGNPGLLKLALSNILQNACKYSDNKDVTLLLYATDSHCIITVNDRGIGIPENEIRYIFDPFFRASNTAEYNGYGVGLPLAQKILLLHRGTITYFSEQGMGTTARISLPFADS